MVLHTQKVVIATVYRTPGTDEEIFEKQLSAVILNIAKYKHYKFFITGDINIDVRINRTHVVSFLNMLSSLNFCCLNEKPTRMDACLDNIISNICRSQVECDTIKLGISDHDGIWLRISNLLTENTSKLITHRLLNKENIERMKNELKLIEWSSILSHEEDVNKCFSAFISQLKLTLETNCLHITKRSSSHKRHKPQHTKKLVHPSP